MILNGFVGVLVEDVYDDMSNGQAGTDNTLFVKSQTGLQSGVGATDIALVDKSFSSYNVSVSHVLDTSTGNGNSLVEYEVNNTSISYNRAVKAQTSKTANIELTTVHTFKFGVVL